MKILIVDNSSRIRQLVKKIIGGNEIEIFECEDGFYSPDEYERIRPDVVLMDINMEKMNGLDASMQILKNYPKAQIIILTNYDDEAMRQKASSYGIRHYILKEDLMQLRDLLKQYRTAN